MSAAEKNAAIASALFDLEGEIADLATMSHIATLLLSDARNDHRCKVADGRVVITLTPVDAEALLFASYEVSARAYRLNEKYLAAYQPGAAS